MDTVAGINFGLAGVGGIVSEFHLPVMLRNPRNDIVAVCDERVDAVRRIAEQIGSAST